MGIVLPQRGDMLKITCPKNPKHNRFSTTAHVMQEWVVDEGGEFVRCADSCMEVTHGPTNGNSFICVNKHKGRICGADAVVEEI
jgi:hypothetical protein